MSRADEVRRPIDEGRLHRRRLDDLRAAVRRTPAEPARPSDFSHVPPDREARAVLPKGRNFQ
jgi:hypothetical protein